MAFATIDVTKGITGTIATSNLPTIPVTKGGTGLTSGTTGQFLKFTGSTAVSSAAVDAGKILQVVSSTNGYNQGSTSSTYADISLSASLTPSATSSKILVLMSVNGIYSAQGDTNVDLTLKRSGASSGNGNVLDFSGTAGFDQGNQGSGDGGASLTYLDSPSSTSSITYTAQMRSSNGSTAAYINHFVRGDVRPKSTITLMEVSA